VKTSPAFIKLFADNCTIDFSVQDKHGSSPLHVAALHANNETVKFLMVISDSKIVLLKNTKVKINWIYRKYLPHPITFKIAMEQPHSTVQLVLVQIQLWK